MTDQLTAEVITVTPEMAHELLGNNPRNRNISSRTTAKLVRAIKNGEWEVNGESIKVDVNGNLIDGQHRLQAIIEADTPIQSLVVSGLPPEAQDTVDIGRPRHLPDILKLNGEVNTTQLASLIRRMMVLERHGLNSAMSGSMNEFDITPQEALVWLKSHGWVRDYCYLSAKIGQRTPLVGGVAGTLAVQFDSLSNEDAALFWDKLMEGVGLTERDPVRALRRFFVNVGRGKSKLHQRSLAAVTIKAWNAFRNGEEVQILAFRPGGAKPEQFPEPV